MNLKSEPRYSVAEIKKIIKVSDVTKKLIRCGWDCRDGESTLNVFFELLEDKKRVREILEKEGKPSAE